MSEACLDPALGLSNDLFNALTRAGHRVAIAPESARLQRAEIDIREDVEGPKRDQWCAFWSPWRPTVVHVGTVAIGLAVVEMSEIVAMRYVKGDYVREADYQRMMTGHRIDERFNWTTEHYLPSGRLRIVAYSPYWRAPWQMAWSATERGSLKSRLREIVAEIESAARDLVPRLEEAERQAQIEEREREAAFESFRREDDARQVELARRESEAQLTEIIEQWSRRMDIERFFEGVEAQVNALPSAERASALVRLKMAQESLGSTDPMAAFLDWRAPDERYRSKYYGAN